VLIIGRSGVYEQHLEHPTRQALVQRRDLRRLIDVENLDLQPAAIRVRQFVQRGPCRSGPNRTDYVPTPFQELGRHRMTQAPRGSDEQNRGWRFTRGAR
jgi:hypothetical protein